MSTEACALCLQTAISLSSHYTCRFSWSCWHFGFSRTVFSLPSLANRSANGSLSVLALKFASHILAVSSGNPSYIRLTVDRNSMRHECANCHGAVVRSAQGMFRYSAVLQGACRKFLSKQTRCRDAMEDTWAKSALSTANLKYFPQRYFKIADSNFWILQMSNADENTRSHRRHLQAVSSVAKLVVWASYLIGCLYTTLQPPKDSEHIFEIDAFMWSLARNNDEYLAFLAIVRIQWQLQLRLHVMLCYIFVPSSFNTFIGDPKNHAL